MGLSVGASHLVAPLLKIMNKIKKLPSYNWIGWKQTLPDVAKDVANKTKKDFIMRGYLVRQKYWKGWGWITYYALPVDIKKFNK